MTAVAFDPANDQHRRELRQFLDESIDEEMLLKALERRVVVHAINGGAEASLRRYISAYLLPLLLIIGAIAAFFGWRFERSLEQTSENVEKNRAAIEAKVKEANGLIDSGRANAAALGTLQTQASGDVAQLTKSSGDFQKQLGAIEAHQATISQRKAEIDQTSALLMTRQVELGAKIQEAGQRAQSAVKSQETVESIVQQAEIAVQRAQIAVKNAEDSAAAAQRLVDEATKNIGSVAASASVADDAAKRAVLGAATVDTLRGKTEKLLRIGILELAMLRSNRVHPPIKLINISNPLAPEYTLTFKTGSLKSGSTLHYEIDGHDYSLVIPSENQLPYTFELKGTGGQYVGVLDFAYIIRPGPDFLVVRIKPVN